ncbi:MAG: hypothetical protein F4X05_11580 [Rhodothermaceae bacterium]|nr:hypothetical protein [Rhodothermaceae bacterium]
MATRLSQNQVLRACRVEYMRPGAAVFAAALAGLLLAAAAFADESGSRVEPDATFDDWFRSQEDFSPESFAAFMYSNTTHPAPLSSAGGPPCPSLLSVRHVKTSTIDQFDELPYYLEWSVARGYAALESLNGDLPIYHLLEVTCRDDFRGGGRYQSTSSTCFGLLGRQGLVSPTGKVASGKSPTRR